MSEATQPAAADPFLEAFARLSTLGDDATQTAVDSVMGATAPAEPATGQDSVASAGEPVTEGQDSVASAEEPVTEGQDSVAGAEEPPEEPKKAPEVDDDELLRRLSALVRKGTPAEEPKKAPAPAVDAPAEPPIYSADEEEFLKTYEKEWPDVARAEALRRKAEYRQLATFIFQEVGTYLKPHLEALQTVATRTHLSDIEARVADYDEVRDKVVDWVGTQPKYLQTAYEQVIREGTVDEVLDLIDRWRQATGATVTQPAPTRQKTTDLPPATKQAAVALAPVGSKRSAPAAGVDPNDFEGAFAVAAANKD
jgi:hypothetical protein